MIGLVAERNPGVEARIRRTGLALAGLSVALFVVSVGFIVLGWWMR
ncbi:MAG: hypothetical protein HY303_01115 [Candidatus Wallbacteria bacterium]|nr:hypothetical protein [Candidatus Wallbacteria bacterium]